MANRVKEDEKNERIIRGLLKLPENKRCINCNGLGPQYVCINFSTFICTTCSGIHREFTHRVKSISMAKFTSQEVTALQEGGNQRAKEMYFKELDLDRHSFPDNSNVNRLRDFIKHAYVDRRYSGARSSEIPPKGKMDGKDDQSRRTDSYQGGSRSPPYGNTYERPYSGKSSPGERSPDERKSPGLGQESPQYSDYKSPARTGVVNDWRRENKVGNERKVESYKISDGDPKLEGRSPDRSKDLDQSIHPIVRPVREILGENVIPLRIIEPPKTNESRTAASVYTQRTASSSSLGSVDSTEVETKVEVSRSLIDFDDPPEPPASSVSQPYQTIAAQSVPQPVSSGNDNWASFDTAPEFQFSHGGFSESKLPSVLSELAISTSVPGNMHTSHFTGGAPLTTPSSGLITPPVSGSNSFVGGAGAPLWPTMQTQQTSLFPSAVVQPMTEQYMPNHTWNASQTANSQGPPSHSTAQLSYPVTTPVQDVTSGVEVKPSGRKELPADIFSATYSSYPAPVPGWHAGPPQGMNFNMQYNTMPVQQFTPAVRSSNPFDLKNEPSHVHTSLSFPSLASLQGSLPAGQPALGLMRSASVDATPSAWMSSQPPFYSASLPPLPSYPSPMPPGVYGQQLPGNIQPRDPRVGGFGGEGASYSNADHQAGERFSAPSSPHPSSRRNPFE